MSFHRPHASRSRTTQAPLPVPAALAMLASEFAERPFGTSGAMLTAAVHESPPPAPPVIPPPPWSPNYIAEADPVAVEPSSVCAPSAGETPNLDQVRAWMGEQLRREPMVDGDPGRASLRVEIPKPDWADPGAHGERAKGGTS